MVFGFWVNPDKEILDDKTVIEKMAKTLKLSKGSIDWDYGLLQRLPEFAKVDPKNTLLIIENYLLDENKNINRNRRMPILRASRIKASLEIIYTKGGDESKQEVENLINTLVEKGSKAFWELKWVLGE